MHILVLGGTRYIGAHCVAALAAAGHELTLFNRGQAAGQTSLRLPDFRLISGDRLSLADYAYELRAVQADVVLDMRPLGEADAQTVCEVLAGHAGRVVAISSVDVYLAYDVLRGLESGSAANGLEPTPLTEQSPLRRKLYPYRLEQPRADDDPQKILDDYDKILMEQVYMGQPDLPATILRLPMVYGPGDYQHRLWEYLGRMQEGRPAIAIDSVAAQWRACRAFVGDVAQAVRLCCEQAVAAGEIFHVAEQDHSSELDWAGRIAAGCGWQGELLSIAAEYWPLEFRCEGNMRQHWDLDSGKIRRMLGYGERGTPEEALRQTIEWETANPAPSVGSRTPGADTEAEIISRWRSAQPATAS